MGFVASRVANRINPSGPLTQSSIGEFELLEEVSDSTLETLLESFEYSLWVLDYGVDQIPGIRAKLRPHLRQERIEILYLFVGGDESVAGLIEQLPALLTYPVKVSSVVFVNWVLITTVGHETR